MRDWPAYLLLGYYLLRSDNVKTSLDSATLRWPVSLLDAGGALIGRGSSVITQEYKPGVHLGVDISVPGHYTDARAKIIAVAAGRVARAYQSVRGFAVLLDHDDYASAYLHMTDLEVKAGDVVTAGQVLGTMGSDPLDAERVIHLHFQIAPGGHTVDPAPYLRGAV